MTITTYQHCVVNPLTGVFAIGSKEEIVSNILTWEIRNRTLFAKHDGFKEVQYFSFNEKFTKEEQYNESIQKLYSTLKDYGYLYFRDIGF